MTKQTQIANLQNQLMNNGRKFAKSAEKLLELGFTVTIDITRYATDPFKATKRLTSSQLEIHPETSIQKYPKKIKKVVSVGTVRYI